MARQEFESTVLVAGLPGQLYASCGPYDDYVELALPEGIELSSPLLERLRRAFPPENDGLDLRLRDGPPVLVSAMALNICAPEARARPATQRLASILFLLAGAAPEFDFGELLPERPRPQLETVRPDVPLAAIGSREPTIAEPEGGDPSGQPVSPTLDPAAGALPESAQRPPRCLAAATAGDLLAAAAAEQTLARAREHVGRGQTRRALDLLEEALRLTPGNEAARQLWQEVELLDRREKRQRREPGNSQAHLEVGFSYLLLDRNREATAALQRACQITPGDYLAQLLLGIAFHREGRVDPARSAYSRAARLRPGENVHGDLLAALERGDPPTPLMEELPPPRAGSRRGASRELARVS